MMLRLASVMQRRTAMQPVAAQRAFSSVLSADSAAVPVASKQRPHLGVAVTVLRQMAKPAADASSGATDAAGAKPRRGPAEFEVLLVRRSKAPLEGWWALPGGSIELGETVEHAGAREVAEETSLAISFRQQPAPFFVTQYIDPQPHEAKARGLEAGSQGHFVLAHVMADWPLSRAKGSGGEQQARAGSDAAEVRWFPAERLADMIARQKAEMLEAKVANQQAMAEAQAKLKAETAAAAGIGAEVTDAPEAEAENETEAAADADAAALAPATPVAPVVPAADEVRIIPVVVRVVREAVRRRRALMAEERSQQHATQQSARRLGQHIANQGLQGKPKPKGPWNKPQQSREGFNNRRDRAPRSNDRERE